MASARSTAKTCKFNPLQKLTSVIVCTHSVGDYVSEVTSPAKYSSVPMSGRDTTWGQRNHAVPVTLSNYKNV